MSSIHFNDPPLVFSKNAAIIQLVFQKHSNYNMPSLFFVQHVPDDDKSENRDEETDCRLSMTADTRRILWHKSRYPTDEEVSFRVKSISLDQK